MKFFGALVLAVSCCFASSPLLAAIPPALAVAPKSSYRLQIVLRLAPNRLLTPRFKAQLTRDLRDGLRADFAELADVTVVETHLLLADVVARGLQQTLGTTTTLAAMKTHFVLIDVVDGDYEIRTRQLDGLTGLPSPLVRQARTADRSLVARLATQLVERDFGPVGQVGELGSSDRIEVTMHGGALPVDWTRWLRVDDVFAVAAVTEQAGELRGDRVDAALLQVVDPVKNGVCVCRLLQRYDKSLSSRPNVLGYRCLALGTTTAPLTLRFVSRDARATPLPGLQVTLSRFAFNDARGEQHSTDRDGFVRSEKAFPQLAYATVASNGKPVARIPLEVLDDRPIVLKVNINPENDRLAQLEQQRNRWIRHLDESIAVGADVVRQLNATLERNRQHALDIARDGVKVLDTDLGTLRAERSALETLANQPPAVRPAVNLADGDKRLQRVQQQRDELAGFITKLDAVMKEESDPKRQEALARIEKAKLLEQDAEYGQALAIYEALLKEGFKDKEGNVVKRAGQLRAIWVPKSNEHREAQDFIYTVWPKLATAAAMHDQFVRARTELDRCQDAGDYLSPEKMRQVIVKEFAPKLAERVRTLRPEVVDEKNELDAIASITEQLRTLDREIVERIAAIRKRKK